MKLSLSKDLTALRNAKLTQIDAEANRALASYRTSSEYAVAVYALKRAELNAYDSGAKTVDELAMLNAEAEAVFERPDVVLETWRRKMAAEDAALPNIEALRQVLKQKVRDARTPEQIEAVLKGVTWP